MLRRERYRANGVYILWSDGRGRQLAKVYVGVAGIGGAADLTNRLPWADPSASEHHIGSLASQLHSFRSDMKEGDVVVLPLKTQRPRVALGRIT